ncbi:HtaA domain-containing protein [Prauserella oleivorans]|uniref:HtaA domain-containing protein n=1 Tax=Prauserella oleivorans TaxID=1478153 RepID=A0ABW5WBF9_9PSEU
MVDDARSPDHAGDGDRAGLTWGLKRSFVAYVARLRDGACGAKDGGSVVDSSYFHFEHADGSGYDPATGKGVLKFRGDVRLVGHAGLLYVMLLDPWLEFTGDGAVLSVVDIEHWPDRSHRLPLATLDVVEPAVGAGGRTWTGMPAYLTSEGQEVFNGQYVVGERLDPVSVVVPEDR